MARTIGIGHQDFGELIKNNYFYIDKTVLLWPKTDRDDAIILEFKVHDPEDEKDLEETAKEVLAQIERMKYAAVLEDGGVDAGKIRKYGFAFEGKKVLIR